MRNSKKIITMLAYNRPAYTKQVIDALKQCIGFEEYTLMPTLDPNDHLTEVLKAFEGLPKCEIVVNKERLGANLCMLQALQRGFDISDYVIHFEDDTVPGIDSLRYFEWANETYKDDKDIFTIAAYNREINVKPENYFSVFKNPFFNCWMFATWKDRFEDINREWNKTGHLDHAMAFEIRKNRHEIMPYLSRCQNIGEYGANVSPEFWRQWHYNPVWVNSVSNISFDDLMYTDLSNIDDIKKFVIEGYVNILKRPLDQIDVDGLSYHINEISSGRLSKKAFLNGLKNSEEYQKYQLSRL